MKKKVILIVALLLIIGLVSIGITYSFYQKELKKDIILNLKGEENIELEVFSDYEELGASASYNDKDYSNDIQISGEVNKEVPGTYELVYSITLNNKETLKKEKKATVKRTVTIIDKTAPVLELNGEKEKTIYIGEKYTDPGFKATDNVDKEITDKVVVTGSVDNQKAGEYKIDYSITDSSNNITTDSRLIKVVTRPVVKSETPVTVNTKVRGLPVLMYHFFYDSTKGEKGNDANWMDVVDFEAQMKYLSDNNFYFPSWSEVEAFVMGSKSLPDKSIVITVDDGDITFLEKAIPIIEKYNVKATSFAVTSWNGSWLQDAYGSEKVEFQSHSHDAHRSGANGLGRLVNMTYEQALEDVTKSRDLLNGSTIFCYPFGHNNDTAIKALKAANYHLAFTTVGGRVYPGSNPYKLPRVRMSRGVSLEAFKSKVA